jgi:tRNA U38,U39,U40 pseudouridine synthase TruA
LSFAKNWASVPKDFACRFRTLHGRFYLYIVLKTAN